MLPDRHAPLHALAAHLREISSKPLGQADTRGRNRQAAGVQGRERDLQSLALRLAMMFSRGTRTSLKLTTPL